MPPATCVPRPQRALRPDPYVELAGIDPAPGIGLAQIVDDGIGNEEIEALRQHLVKRPGMEARRGYEIIIMPQHIVRPGHGGAEIERARALERPGHGDQPMLGASGFRPAPAATALSPCSTTMIGA